MLSGDEKFIKGLEKCSEKCIEHKISNLVCINKHVAAKSRDFPKKSATAMLASRTVLNNKTETECV